MSDILIPFDNSYAALPEGFAARTLPTVPSDPKLIAFNADLAQELGIQNLEGDLAAAFSGKTIPLGAEPIAQLYSGHQFGHYNQQLGDGRAHLLGEVVDASGQRFDIQLKGSGQTPFSRSGDGKAWLGPVLREYVISEAMHALGIPTTRALAAVLTGDSVYRETELPGAVLTRVAASHIRVGTFQVFAARGQHEHLRMLFEYTRDRHYPEAETPLDFLNAVINAQAKLIAQWMGVGFIHGVMNTDNCQIAGQTIDYGPCAFMDTYHPVTVYSSIDRMGRYAYANQADIIVWNMAQLATSLVPLVPDQSQAIEDFTTAIHAMPALVQSEWTKVFSKKIGINNPQEDDAALIKSLLELMQEQSADFTNTFAGLSQGTAAQEFTNPSAFVAWETLWEKRIASEAKTQDVMTPANPILIPRNHQIERMIQAALQEDYAPFERLNRAYAKPFDRDAEFDDLTQPPQPNEVVEATFCGT